MTDTSTRLVLGDIADEVEKNLSYFLPTTAYTRRRDTDTVVIHCAMTTKKQDIGVKTIRGWHVNENGWSDIGYHIVIRRDGTVETGRPLWAVGAHVKGHNATSIGICLVGGSKAVATGKKNSKGEMIYRLDEENNFTDEQWASLLKIVKGLMDRYTITAVCGHRDFPKVKKYCPSFDVSQWMKDNKKAFHEDA